MTPHDLPASREASALVVRVDFGSCTLVTARGETLEATARGRLMGARTRARPDP